MSACSTLTSHEEHKVHDMLVDSRETQGLAGGIVLKTTRMQLPLDPESETYQIVLKSQKA